MTNQRVCKKRCIDVEQIKYLTGMRCSLPTPVKNDRRDDMYFCM